MLDRIAHALMLTESEREHLFLLGLGRPPEAHFQRTEGVTPRLQRVLDKLDPTPAILRTAIWDVVAWNRAALVLLGDYRHLPASRRNALRILFLEYRDRAKQTDWERVARHIVGSFRTDISRAGAAADAAPLIADLCAQSAEFARLWRDNDVHGNGGEGVKHLLHPDFGPIGLEYSVFSVDSRPDLQLVIYNPVIDADVDRIAERARRYASAEAVLAAE